MPIVVESPPPVLHHGILTGHFMSSGTYRAWRSKGTGDWLLILTVSGSGVFGAASGLSFQTTAGDLVLIRPGTRHDYRITPGADVWEHVWAHFYPSPDWDELLQWPEIAPGLMRLGPLDWQTIRRRFEEVHRLALSSLPGRERFAMNALEEVLLWCTLELPNALDRPSDSRIQAVMQTIRARMAEKLSLQDLADACGLSSSRMAVLFRGQLGVTPIQFLEDQRLSRARQLLLRTTMPVYAIAAETGFDNPFYFTLRFKRLHGLAPLAWRRANAQR